MASEAILIFLEEHNRPFSSNEIQSGINGEFGKSAVQKALDALVEKQKIKEKVYGKQKVYCILQNNDASASETREHLLEIDREITDISIQLKETTDKIKINSHVISEIKGKMTLAEVIDKNLELEKELSDIQEKLKAFDDVELVSPKTKLTAEKDHEKYLSEYKKRKRICMDVLNSILENYPKSKKHLFEEIGIETDEDAGFSIDKI